MEVKEENREPQRVIVYVDGFNFYYGLRASERWRRYYWLDIVKLFELFMRPNQELVCVKYFSARPHDTEKSKRQNAFFQANNKNPKFQLILGRYLKKEIKCFQCENIIHTYEEKESDVRLATQIVADAYQGNCDIAIVVSADSDMIPAIELAVQAGKEVFIYFPPNQKSSNLVSLVKNKPVFLSHFEKRFHQSLLPEVVHLSSIDLEIPSKWKDYQRQEEKADS